MSSHSLFQKHTTNKLPQVKYPAEWNLINFRCIWLFFSPKLLLVLQDTKKEKKNWSYFSVLLVAYWFSDFPYSGKYSVFPGLSSILLQKFWQVYVDHRVDHFPCILVLLKRLLSLQDFVFYCRNRITISIKILWL